MTACLGWRLLCDEVKEDGNTHRCFLDKGHGGSSHLCVCWHRWPTGDKAEPAPTPDEKIAEAPNDQ